MNWNVSNINNPFHEHGRWALSGNMLVAAIHIIVRTLTSLSWWKMNRSCANWFRGRKKNRLVSRSLMAVTRKTSVSLLFPLPLCCSVIMFHFPLLIQTFPLCLPPQAGSSASMARGVSRASWPCPVLWAITPWRTSTWSSPIPTSCRLTWISCSQSSWSWRRMACGIPSATRRRFASSESDWTSHISAPRASSSSPSIAVAPTTSPSWWSSLKARPASSRRPVGYAQYLYYVWI